MIENKDSHCTETSTFLRIDALSVNLSSSSSPAKDAMLTAEPVSNDRACSY